MFTLLHPGSTKYHHIGLIVPLLAALSPMLLSKLFQNSGLSQVSKALVFGVIVAAVSYASFVAFPVLADVHYKLNAAVLLGLLVSEVTVFSDSRLIPSATHTAFFLFMYLFGISEIAQLH